MPQMGNNNMGVDRVETIKGMARQMTKPAKGNKKLMLKSKFKRGKAKQKAM